VSPFESTMCLHSRARSGRTESLGAFPLRFAPLRFANHLPHVGGGKQNCVPFPFLPHRGGAEPPGPREARPEDRLREADGDVSHQHEWNPLTRPSTDAARHRRARGATPRRVPSAPSARASPHHHGDEATLEQTGHDRSRDTATRRRASSLKS
jgi:hypothetical protein